MPISEELKKKANQYRDSIANIKAEEAKAKAEEQRKKVEQEKRERAKQNREAYNRRLQESRQVIERINNNRYNPRQVRNSRNAKTFAENSAKNNEKQETVIDTKPVLVNDEQQEELIAQNNNLPVLSEDEIQIAKEQAQLAKQAEPVEQTPVESVTQPVVSINTQSTSFLDKASNYLYNLNVGVPIKLAQNVYRGLRTADKYLAYAEKAYDIHQKHKRQANISLETNGYYKIGQIDENDNQYVNLDDIYARDTELNKSNLSAIQGARHNGNYVVIDKTNKRLHIFDKNNNLLFTTPNIATGASHNDYNTITFVDSRGEIRDNLGNMSTPAGITEITGTSPYHGAPSWTRARVNNDKVNKQDEIASSFHVGNIHLGSNGCVRMDKKTLKSLVPYLTTGTRVYTLPERPGSRFTLREGKLSFTADNPYGQTEGSKKYWDDYNTSYDRTYSPLFIETNENYKGISDDYNQNVNDFAYGITQNKEILMQEFGIDSKTYNDVARLAMGIAQQESKFGTAESYELKQLLNDDELAKVRYYKATILGKGKKRATRSRGLTQIKMNADNDTVKARYNKYNVTTESIKNPETSALATMIRLLSMYNDELRGRHQIKDINGNEISAYDALLYKYLGKNIKELDTNVDPKSNKYIRNVNTYGNEFNYYTRRTLAKGGRI